jgi:hypothetical protein
LVIEWDALAVEMSLLAAIIYGAIYVESWAEKRQLRHKEKENARQTIRFVTDDLKKRLQFIDNSIQYKDYKPFFTDMWDAVLLGGRHTLLLFYLFEDIQHTYSWMKYYNNELEHKQKDNDADLLKILNEVKSSIVKSVQKLEATKL